MLKEQQMNVLISQPSNQPTNQPTDGPMEILFFVEQEKYGENDFCFLYKLRQNEQWVKNSECQIHSFDGKTTQLTLHWV